MRTSKRIFGLPTISNSRGHLVISIFLAQPTTTSKASSKWSRNSMVVGRRSLAVSFVPSESDIPASSSTTV